MHKPPHRREERHPPKNHRVIIHRRDIYGQRVRETEDDVEEDDEDERERIDGVSPLPHPERALREVLAAGEEMAADSEGVGGGGEDDEGADEVGEGGFGAERDGAEGGGHDAGEDCGGDGAGEGLVDGGEER
jgi:hypothetical protein